MCTLPIEAQGGNPGEREGVLGALLGHWGRVANGKKSHSPVLLTNLKSALSGSLRCKWHFCSVNLGLLTLSLLSLAHFRHFLAPASCRRRPSRLHSGSDCDDHKARERLSLGDRI